MAFNKLPDSMLPKFTCSKCNRYVTMAPIAVEADGKISCGDCTDWTVPKVRCNLLESLATLYAFPCKYKQAGCPEYLAFNNSREHESTCEFHTFQCPYGLLNDTCKWAGIATSMLRHYKRQHPQFSAHYPNFKITLDEEYEKYYMIEIDHILLLLQIKSSNALEKLWFNMVYFGDPANANFIRYRVNLSCKDVSKQVITLKSKTAVGIDNMKMDVDKSIDIHKKTLKEVFEGTTYLHCSWNINVYVEQDDIIKVDSDDEDSETCLIEAKSRNTSCPNCNVLMIPPIFRCATESHITCLDCKGYYNECKMCQKNDMLFKRADDLEKISQLKFYNCRWTNCNEVQTYQTIRLHEQSCSHRIFKCPKCNIWSGDTDSLFEHFRVTHPKLRLTATNPLYFNRVRFIPGYILTHNELFLLEVDMDFRNKIFSCTVTYLGPPYHFNDWEFNLSTRNGRSIEQSACYANVVSYNPLPAFCSCFKLSINRVSTKQCRD